MADGRVVIGTDLDNRGFIASSKEMLAAISSLQRTTIKTGNEIRRSASGFGTAMRQNAQATRMFVSSADVAYDKLGNLEEALERIGKTRVSTEEFAKLNKEYEIAAEKAEKLNTKLMEMEQLGKNFNPNYVKLGRQMEEAYGNVEFLNEQLEKAKAKRDELNAQSPYGHARVERDKELYRTEMLIERLQRQYDAAIAKADELQYRVDEMERNGATESDAYKSLKLQYDAARTDAAGLYEKRQDMIESGTAQQLYEETQGYRALSSVFEDVVARYNDMITAGRQALKPPDLQAWERMKTLSGMISEGFGRIQFAASMAGRAIIHPFQTLNRVLGFVASKAIGAASSLAKMAGNAALSYLKRLATNARNAAIQLAKIAGNAIATGIRNIGSMAADGAKKLLGLGRSAKQSGRGFKFSLFNLIKYGFGVRSVFVLVNRLRKALTDAFGVLAKKFPSFNKAMSQMVTALNRLKNSFGAAFAPIVTAAAPYITKFLNMLSDAMTRLGMFIAMLTGQKYYYQATAVQEDYAKSLDKTASSNKKAAKAQEEANRQLASFDELNILSDKDNSNTSPTSDTSGAGLTQVPVSSITGWIAELKKAFEAGDFDEIGKVIAEKINEIFTKVDNLIKWDNVGATITKYIDAFTGVVNSMVDNINWDLIGKTVGDGINTLVNSFYRLATDVDWGSIGTSIGTGLNGLLYSVDWGKLGETVSAWLRARFIMIGDAAATFSWGDAGTKFADALKGLFDQKTFDELGDMLYNAIGGIFTAIRTFVSEFSWGDAGTMFGNAINHLFTIVDAIKLGATLKKMILAAIKVVKNAIKEVDFKAAGKVLADNLNDLFNVEKDDNVFAELGGIIDTALKGVLNFGEAFLRNFKEDDFAQSVKDFLGRVDWVGIVNKAWELLGIAAKKIGNFLTVLLGGQSARMDYGDGFTGKILGSVYSQFADYEGLGENLAKAIGNGIAKVFNLGAELLSTFDAKAFGDKITELLDEVPWQKIANALWEFLSEALKTVADLGDSIRIGPFTLNEVLFPRISAVRNLKHDWFGNSKEEREKEDALDQEAARKAAEYYANQGVVVDASTLDADAKIINLDSNGEVVLGNTAGKSTVFDSDEDLLALESKNALKNAFKNMSGKLPIEAKKVEITDSKVEYDDENYIPMTGSAFSAAALINKYAGTIKKLASPPDTIEKSSSWNPFAAAAEESGPMIKRIQDITDKFNKSLASAVTGSKKSVSSIVGNVSSGLGKLNSQTASQMTTFKDAIVRNAEESSSQAQATLRGFGDFTGYMLGEIVSDASNNAQLIGQNTANLAQLMKTSTGSAFDYIRTNSTLTANTMSTNARTAETNTSSAFTRASAAVENSISSVFNSIMNRDWYGIGNTISSGVNSAGSSILNNGWYNIGQSIVWGLQAGIDREAQNAYNQVRNFANNIARMMANALRIHSPSKVFEYQGEMIGAGLSIGIESSGKESISVTEKVGQKIAEALNSIKAIDAIKNGLGIHTDASTYRTPQIATGTVMPYAIAAEAELTDADVLTEAIETSNDDLASVIIQAFNNATATIVQAIRENSGKGQSLDRRTLANAVIDEINQRTRAQGKSPLLI